MYLRGFGTPRKKTHHVQVLDLQTGEWRRQSVKKALRERDFYRIDLERLDPNAVESQLGKFESECAPLLQRLDSAGRRMRLTGRRLHLSDRDRFLLVGFVALMHVRTAPRRDQVRRDSARLGQALLKQLEAVGAGGNERLRLALATAVHVGAIRPEDLGELATRAGPLAADINPTFRVGVMMDAWQDLWKLLITRGLTLRVGGRRAGLFVASDCPVSVTRERVASAAEGVVITADPRDRETGLVMPLTADVAVEISAWAHDGFVRTVPPEAVAQLNTLTLVPDRGVAIARTREFGWWDGRRVRRSSEVSEQLIAPHQQGFQANREAATERRVAHMLDQSIRPRRRDKGDDG